MKKKRYYKWLGGYVSTNRRLKVLTVGTNIHLRDMLSLIKMIVLNLACRTL